MAKSMATISKEMEDVITEALINAKGGKDCVKQVANSLKVDQNVVRTIYNTRGIGQKRKAAKEAAASNTATKKKIIINVSDMHPTTNYSSYIPVSNILVPEEQPINSDNSNSNDTKKNGYFISDEIKIAIAMDHESGEYTQRQLSEKYAVSVASVSRIIKELGGTKVAKRTKPKTAKKSTLNNHQYRQQSKRLIEQYIRQAAEEEDKENAAKVEEKLEEKPQQKQPKVYIVSDQSSDSSEENISEHEHEDDVVRVVKSTSLQIEKIDDIAVKAGLCKDRHNMTVDKYIYETLTQQQMFDYNWLYNTACEFIKEECNSKALYLYCTGMQCALAAVIKAAFDLKCSLSLFHYNAYEKTYCRQNIWKFAERNDDSLSQAVYNLTRKGLVFLHNKDKIDTNKFFVISVNRVSDSGDNFLAQSFVLCDSIESAFSIYQEYVKEIISNPEKKMSVFITQSHIDESVVNGDKFFFDLNISKCYNFK